MSGTGVTDFVSQWMRIPPYIDGVRIDPFDPEHPPTWGEDAGGTALLATHGGTHRIQGLYLGAARALEFAPQEWNFGALVATEEDLFRLKRAKRKGGRVIFAPFVWGGGGLRGGQRRDLPALAPSSLRDRDRVRPDKLPDPRFPR
jgi:hypothetical protein